MDKFKGQLTTFCLAFALGGFFVYTGVLKIWSTGPKDFLESIRSYHLIGDPWAALVAVFLPILEIVAGLAVILGLKRRAAAALLAIQLVVFISALASTLVRGIDVHCGCFGPSKDSTNVPRQIALDAILFLAAVRLMKF
jgi:putative oxidoreductase